MRVIAKNRSYNGTSASIVFVNGVGYTDDPYLLEWFRDHGYLVEEKPVPDDNKKSEEKPKNKKGKSGKKE